jgi:hypothetical protein
MVGTFPLSEGMRFHFHLSGLAGSGCALLAGRAGLIDGIDSVAAMPIGRIAVSGRHTWVPAGVLGFMLAAIR